ncbi:MAG: ferredoxin family protein [Terracidiphilus sp.]|nr:ferredoxin family protein [Terracidiphilus sp.]
MPNISVITDSCIKDYLCVAVCLRKAIHPKKDEAGAADPNLKQLFINPKKCLSCGSCIAACQNGAIFDMPDLPPEKAHFAALNAAYYKK